MASARGRPEVRVQGKDPVVAASFDSAPEYQALVMMPVRRVFGKGRPGGPDTRRSPNIGEIGRGVKYRSLQVLLYRRKPTRFPARSTDRNLETGACRVDDRMPMSIPLRSAICRSGGKPRSPVHGRMLP